MRLLHVMLLIKCFATEIVNLGSVLWLAGIPKISDLYLQHIKYHQILKNLMRLIQLLRLVVWLRYSSSSLFF
jgi:hypothetical protein